VGTVYAAEGLTFGYWLGGEAEQAFHAITAVGWRLHTWAVSAAGALPQ
jgi:hypothetical protein